MYVRVTCTNYWRIVTISIAKFTIPLVYLVSFSYYKYTTETLLFKTIYINWGRENDKVYLQLVLCRQRKQKLDCHHTRFPSAPLEHLTIYSIAWVMFYVIRQKLRPLMLIACVLPWHSCIQTRTHLILPISRWEKSRKPWHRGRLREFLRGRFPLLQYLYTSKYWCHGYSRKNRKEKKLVMLLISKHVLL